MLIGSQFQPHAVVGIACLRLTECLLHHRQFYSLLHPDRHAAGVGMLAVCPIQEHSFRDNRSFHRLMSSLIPRISMLFAIVNGGLESLEGCLVNPLQPLALILGNTRACHQEPACGKLCLGIATMSR